MIPLFDLHCDTLTKLYDGGFSYENAPLHISKEKTASFAPYVQVFAVFTDEKIGNENGYRRFFDVLSYANEQPLPAHILSVEDGRILNNDLSRLDILYQNGVRILTPVWSGVSCIGGAWNTDVGLSDFGKAVVQRCFEIGIVPDISHASVLTAKEIIRQAKIANLPILATHSNLFSVCAHRRNLSNELFSEVCQLGGLAGISLCPTHLSMQNATADDIFAHIHRFLSLGGENHLSFGCDFDGISSLPSGIENVSSLENLYEETVKRFGKTITQKIFYQNAFDFFRKEF